jgi:hypothetical protein
MNNSILNKQIINIKNKKIATTTITTTDEFKFIKNVTTVIEYYIIIKQVFLS